MPLPHHEPGLDVDLLDHGVGEDAVGLAVDADRFISIGSNASTQAVPSGSTDLVQVGVIAVAGADVADLLVVSCVEHVFALAEADLEDPPLPPGQGRLALDWWTLKFVADMPARQRVEPDQVAVLVGDHRPRRALALVGGEEQIAGAAPGLAGVVICTVDGVSDGAAW